MVSDRPAAKAGLRTFALTALLGVLTAHLATALGELWLVAVGLLLVGGAYLLASATIDRLIRKDAETTGTLWAADFAKRLDVLTWGLKSALGAG